MEYILSVFPFLFGIVCGSFINVAILRMPEERDFVWQRSACPKCFTKIRWYDNIPILSFAILRAKCRSCESPISWQYPLIELWHGLLALFIFSNWWQVSTQTHIEMLAVFMICAIFTAHFIIDLRYQLLLDKLNLALLIPVLTLVALRASWPDALIGGTVGLVLPLLVTWLFYMMRGQIGLGGGDIKLFAILGMLFGVKGVMLNLFTSCMLGSLVTLFLMAIGKVKRDQAIPFGPYILLVAAWQLLAPELFEQWEHLLIPY